MAPSSSSSPSTHSHTSKMTCCRRSGNFWTMVMGRPDVRLMPYMGAVVLYRVWQSLEGGAGGHDVDDEDVDDEDVDDDIVEEEAEDLTLAAILTKFSDTGEVDMLRPVDQDSMLEL